MALATIYLAGGCFWGTQKFLDQFKGVLETECGYANGKSKNPTYQEVCAGSGHAETVKVVFDPEILSLKKLLDFYFLSINPTAINHQGGDFGIQYRTGIYYEDPTLKDPLSSFMNEKAGEIEEKGGKLAVELKPLENYYSAEEYHQKYLDKNPGGYCHIRPELLKL
ncbi:MAG: peptide-methionine (S)-S-oxide reductase MsrA [Lachnospiraceae bacterium]|nr:peptide-methionine (S)-S-oxide reductase MsrA [Lachnospiraceae bacterium]